ncbi:hypothetical protein CL614_03005 [archaeon]|nr:hypothetical protein [archaeon]|tara:strand:- start:19218 stop:19433 length:216 start_codon:yes stop_codon:yes gene_type:complete
MSNVSQINALGAVLSKGILKEIQKQTEGAPGGWTLRSSNESFLQQGAQCYAAVSDGNVAKIGLKGSPVVGK